MAVRPSVSPSPSSELLCVFSGRTLACLRVGNTKREIFSAAPKDIHLVVAAAAVPGHILTRSRESGVPRLEIETSYCFLWLATIQRDYWQLNNVQTRYFSNRSIAVPRPLAFSSLSAQYLAHMGRGSNFKHIYCVRCIRSVIRSTEKVIGLLLSPFMQVRLEQHVQR